MSDRRPSDLEDRLESAFAHIGNPLKRAFLRAYAEVGQKRKAAQMAGIHKDTPYSDGWRDDRDFQEALELARQMTGDMLEEEMIRRGVEGVPRVRFHNKSGEPLRDPLTCECGRPRDEHVRTPEGDWGPHPSVEDCLGFTPGVYVEHEYSDRLLEQLARSHLPERYAQRHQVAFGNGTLAGIPYEQLPDRLIHRVTQEKWHPLAALVAELEEHRAWPRALGPGESGGQVLEAEILPASSVSTDEEAPEEEL